MAALVFATTATVDYETVAKPLSAVLEDLSKQTGVEMRASKGLEGDKLVIRVDDAELPKLREKMAEAVAGKWSEKDGVFILQRDDSEVRDRERKQLNTRIGYFTERVEELLAAKPDPASEGEWAVVAKIASANDNFLGEVLSRVDMERLAQLQFWERITYSDTPTSMQEPVPNLRRVLDDHLANHNARAKEFAIDAPEVPVGSQLDRMLAIATHEWSGPLRVVVDAMRGTDFVTIDCSVFDADGVRVDHLATVLSGRRLFRMPEGLPDFNPSDVVPITPTSREVARVFTNGGVQKMIDGSFEMTADTFARLARPTQFDPLTFHLSEMIIGLGAGLEMQIVAAVDDRMVGHLQSENITLGSVATYVFYSERMWNALDGGWITIGRASGPHVDMDRQVVERLIAKSQKRTLALDEMAEFAANAPRTYEGLSKLYAWVFFKDSMVNPGLWTALEVYRSLSTSERLKLRAGESISFGSLLPSARNAITQAIYRGGPASYTVPDSMRGRLSASTAFPASEIIPTGIPSTATISIRSSTTPYGVAAAKSERHLSGMAFSPRLIAMYATTTSTDAMPQISRFWIGEQIGYLLEISFRPEVKAMFTLYENKIDMTGELFDIQTATKAFKDAYDQAITDRNKRRGGGQ